MSERCYIRRTSDGQPVRVRGDIAQDLLDTVAMKARALIEATCRAESQVPMPLVAQRMHGREYYTCGRPKDHEGPHRWPAKGDRIIAEWDEP